MTNLLRMPKIIRANLIAALILMLMIFALSSCNSSASSSDIDTTQFNQELRKTIPKLASTDLFLVRNAIGEIPLSRDPQAKILLEALWDGDAIPGVNMEHELLQSPIVRSKIAQGLIKLGNTDREYTDYIQLLTRDQDLTIQIVGLEALRDIGDPGSMDLLSTFSAHPNLKVAEIAIAGIRHYIDYGQNREYALRLWEQLKASPAVDQAIVNQYDKMYVEYKKSVTTP